MLHRTYSEVRRGHTSSGGLVCVGGLFFHGASVSGGVSMSETLKSINLCPKKGGPPLKSINSVDGMSVDVRGGPLHYSRRKCNE